jgi:hypothetical protein
MIHYHGAPCTPNSAALELYSGRHACVSFAHPEQLPLIAEVAQSFILDNGAFSAWKSGGEMDVSGFADWGREWVRHPGFDWLLIPDVIDGSEHDNEAMMATWFKVAPDLWKVSVPVWHLHESLDRLAYMAAAWPRIALGSSGEYAQTETPRWWSRMAEAMGAVCDERGRPKCRLHGLRMLSNTIISHIPLASADSTNVAVNIGIDSRWGGSYQPASKGVRALVLADRIERHATAARWTGSGGVQRNLDLLG